MFQIKSKSLCACHKKRRLSAVSFGIWFSAMPEKDKNQSEQIPRREPVSALDANADRNTSARAMERSSTPLEELVKSKERFFPYCAGGRFGYVGLGSKLE
jgi:hypothetical protein